MIDRLNTELLREAALNQRNGDGTPPVLLPAAETEERERLAFRAMDCAELVAGDFEVDFLVEGLLVESQPCILAGPMKAMKTSLLVDLCFSVATAGHFLGRFPVRAARRVCLFTGESGLGTIQETVLRIAARTGHDPAAVRNLLVVDAVPALDSREQIEAVERLILENEIELLAIDPCYLAMPGIDAGNLFVQGRLLRAISAACRRHGVTLILCHHTRKGAGVDGEPLGLESIAWAGFAEFARQWLLVSRRERYEPGTGEHRLHLAAGGSAGHSGLWAVNITEGTRNDEGGRFWQVEVLDHSELAVAQQGHRERERAERLEQDRELIVRVLTGLPEQRETKTAIRDLCPIKHARFDAALATLIQDGSLESAAIAKGNNQQYQGWRLANE